MTALLDRATAAAPASAKAVLPLALVEPTLAQVIAGACTVIRRPAGAGLRDLQAGDRLWIREPFHLEQRFEGLAPLAAVRMGARPTFAADISNRRRNAEGLGRRRFAREMPRIWHRQHLLVDAVRHEPIQSIPLKDIAGEGFKDSLAYAAHWDRNLGYFTPGPAGRGNSWRENPVVLVIAFERIEGAAL